MGNHADSWSHLNNSCSKTNILVQKVRSDELMSKVKKPW